MYQKLRFWGIFSKIVHQMFLIFDMMVEDNRASLGYDVISNKNLDLVFRVDQVSKFFDHSFQKRQLH